MTDEQASQDIPPAYGHDDELLLTVAHALRLSGRRSAHRADHFMAKRAAEPIVEALRRSYVITPKPPPGRRATEKGPG